MASNPNSGSQTGVVDYLLTSIDTPSSAPADESSSINITVHVKNSDGSAVAGFTPTFSITGSGVIESTCSASNASGESICPLKASYAGSKTFTLTNAKSGLQKTLTFTASGVTPGSNLSTAASTLTSGSWNQFNSSVAATADVSAPDDSNSAFKVTDNSASSNHGLIQTVPLATGTYTESIFVKVGTLPAVSVRSYNAGTIEENYSFLLPGATPTYASAYGQTMVGTSTTVYTDGWVRYSVTYILASSVSLDIRYFVAQSGTDNYVGTGTDYSYFWGPKLETGTSPTIF